MTQPVDRLSVLLITALKDEWDQVLAVEAGAVGPPWRQYQGRTGRVMAEREFHRFDHGILQVLTTWATEMGGIAAAGLAGSLIEQYRPDCVAMSGICAGRYGKIALGDVIIADRLWSYDSGKVIAEYTTEGVRTERFFGDMYQHRLAHRWKQRAELFHVSDASWLAARPLPLEKQGDWLLLRLLNGDDPYNHSDRSTKCPEWADAITFFRKLNFLSARGLKLTKAGRLRAEELLLLQRADTPAEPFRIHVAPLATGTQVIEDPQIFDRLSVSMRKVLGLEMEASALGVVGELTEVPAIVMKGVSDFSFAKDDHFRSFAARASAECVIGFLREHLSELLTPYSGGASASTPVLPPDHVGSSRRHQLNILPRDVATFTGRHDECEQMVAALRASAAADSPVAVAIHAIDGMPGIGKTALAVHVAHLITAEFPDAQLFIELHGYTPGREPVSPAAALDHLLRLLGIPPAIIPLDVDAKAALWRSELARSRAVVVLDNANSADQIRPLVPGVAGTCVLITSRRRLVGVEGVEPVSLDVLTTSESLALLRRIAGRAAESASDDALLEVAKLCGFLPLAIQLIGNRWRHRQTWQVDDVLTKLRGARTGVGTFVEDSAEIATAFRVSYDALSADQQMLFRLLGLHPGPDATSLVGAVLLDVQVEQAEALLDGLVDQSLISEDKSSRYRFHDLLRAYSRETVLRTDTEEDRRRCTIRLLEFYVHAIETADRVLDPHRWRLEFPGVKDPFPTPRVPDHAAALEWLGSERLNALACIQLAHDMGEYVACWRLTHYLARYLSTAGYNRDARHIHEMGRDAAIKLGNRHMEAASIGDLAETSQDSGDFESALQSFSESLGIWGELGAADGEARALTGMGFTFERTGEYEEALRALTRALEIRRSRRDAHGEGHVLNAIGAVRWRLHEYEAALSIFNDALVIRQRINDRYGETRTMNNIGFTYQRIGDYPQALEWLDRALKSAEQLGDRSSANVTINNFGYTLERMGDIQGAIAYATRGLALAREVGSLYEEGRALDCMARCAFSMGDRGIAAERWNEALLVFEKAGVPEGKEMLMLIGAPDGEYPGTSLPASAGPDAPSIVDVRRR